MKIKHKFKDLEFQVYHQLSEVKSVWENELPLNHHLLSAEYWAIEKSRLDGFSFYYVNVLNSEKKIVSLFYFQLVELKADNFKTGNCVESSVLKLLLGYKTSNLLVCGNLFKVNQPGYHLQPKYEPYLTDLILTIKKQLSVNNHILGVLIKDCENSINDKFYNCNSFVPFNEDITMMLKIRSEWKGVSDYCDSLKKKYKQRFLKVKSSASDLSVRELSQDEIEEMKNVLEKLYLNVLEKQNFTLGKINSNYFIEMKKTLGNRFKLFAYFKNKDLIAFSSHIYYPNNNEMEIHYIGIDYDYNSTHQLYFNILCDGIKSAIETNCHILELGRTAKEAKANLGAIPLFNKNYIYLNSRIIKSLMRLIIKQQLKNNSKDWLNRQPFRVLESSL
jgi:hypothetical protein